MQEIWLVLCLVCYIYSAKHAQTLYSIQDRKGLGGFAVKPLNHRQQTVVSCIYPIISYSILFNKALFKHTIISTNQTTPICLPFFYLLMWRTFNMFFHEESFRICFYIMTNRFSTGVLYHTALFTLFLQLSLCSHSCSSVVRNVTIVCIKAITISIWRWWHGDRVCCGAWRICDFHFWNRRAAWTGTTGNRFWGWHFSCRSIHILW